MKYVITLNYPQLQVYLCRNNLDNEYIWVNLESGVADPVLFPSEQDALDWVSSEPTKTPLPYKNLSLDEFFVLRVMSS